MAEDVKLPTDQLVEFARWVIDGSWLGFDLDGGEIQRKASELGLICEASYNPALHGGSDVAELGDQWFVFTELLSRRSAPPVSQEAGEPVALTFGYTNWRGEYGERRAIPLAVYFGATDWHPEPQWLLKALDLDKNAERDFALADMGHKASPPAPIPADVSREFISEPLIDPIDMRKALEAGLRLTPRSSPPPQSPASADEFDEAYEIGKRDGYEEAVQELDVATGGDGEFKGSTFSSETVDVPVMRQRIIDRLAAPAPASVPEGMVLVPREPTEAMVEVGEGELLRQERRGPRWQAKYIWDAMIAAAATNGGGV